MIHASVCKCPFLISYHYFDSWTRSAVHNVVQTLDQVKSIYSAPLQLMVLMYLSF